MFDLGLTVTDKVSTYLLQRHERGQHHLLLDFLDELQGDLARSLHQMAVWAEAGYVRS